jgi:FAD/FMN-containing dehydrogenase
MFIDMTRGNDFAFIQKINHEVADHLFPHRTDQTMFLKLYEEVSEIVRNPGSADEIADVIIMLLDHASRHNVNAAHAVLLKLSTNLNRAWEIDPITGVAHHIKPEDGL